MFLCATLSAVVQKVLFISSPSVLGRACSSLGRAHSVSLSRTFGCVRNYSLGLCMVAVLPIYVINQVYSCFNPAICWLNLMSCSSTINLRLCKNRISSFYWPFMDFIDFIHTTHSYLVPTLKNLNMFSLS